MPACDLTTSEFGPAAGIKSVPQPAVKSAALMAAKLKRSDEPTATCPPIYLSTDKTLTRCWNRRQCYQRPLSRGLAPNPLAHVAKMIQLR